MMDDPLYDSHAHLFTHDVARYPIDLRNAKADEETLRQRVMKDSIPPERLLKEWDESGVVGGAGVQYNSVYKFDNSYVLDCSDQHPARISAVIMLRAVDAETPETLRRLIEERGVVGLRLFGRPDEAGEFPWLDSSAALETWSVAERHRLPIVIMYIPADAASAALPRIGALARRFPNTPIVLDHVGWPVGADADVAMSAPLLALREFRNVYLKVTSINFRRFEDAGVDAARFVALAAERFGADRLMWGSDIGNTGETYARMAERARAAAERLSAADRRKFLCDTGRRLFERRAAS